MLISAASAPFNAPALCPDISSPIHPPFNAHAECPDISTPNLRARVPVFKREPFDDIFAQLLQQSFRRSHPRRVQSPKRNVTVNVLVVGLGPLLTLNRRRRSLRRHHRWRQRLWRGCACRRASSTGEVNCDERLKDVLQRREVELLAKGRC